MATLQVKRDGAISNDVARLKSARFVHTSESKEGARLDEAFIKSATGGDTIVARFLYQESFQFRPAFKLWLATNHKPVIRGTDRAIWDRIRLIPFHVTIPLAERIPARLFLPRLLAELPGILAWAVAGALAYQRDGLDVPTEVVDATTAYRQEMDVLTDFLDECCMASEQRPLPFDERLCVPSAALYAAYVEWCQENREKPISRRELAERLKERGFEPVQIGGKRVRGWRGLSLKAA